MRDALGDRVLQAFFLAFIGFLVANRVQSKSGHERGANRPHSGPRSVGETIGVAFGLSFLAFQVPLYSIISKDDQSLFLGQWDAIAFAMMWGSAFVAIPLALGLVIYLLRRWAPEIGQAFIVLLFLYFAANQALFGNEALPRFSSLLVLCFFAVGLYFRPVIWEVTRFSGWASPALAVLFVVQLYPFSRSDASAPFDVRDAGVARQGHAQQEFAGPIFFLTFEKLVASYFLDETGVFLREEFPNLGEFLDSAIHFRNAYANSTSTVYSLASYYTGSVVVDRGRLREIAEIPGTLKNIVGTDFSTVIVLDVLSNYCRASEREICIKIIGSSYISRKNLVEGFLKTYLRTSVSSALNGLFETTDWTFNTWEDLWGQELLSDGSEETRERPMVHVGRRAFEALMRATEKYGGKSLYIAHNFISDSPEIETWLSTGRNQDQQKEAMSTVRANLREFDAEFGRLIQHIKRLGLYERALIFVGADTGYDGHIMRNASSFGAEISYNRELLEIFMALKLPHQDTPRRVDAPAQAVDILPTILTAIGAPFQQDQFEGRNLLGSEDAVARRAIRFFVPEDGGKVFRYLPGAESLVAEAP